MEGQVWPFIAQNVRWVRHRPSAAGRVSPSGSFRSAGSMISTQFVDTATLLANGSVLVTGNVFDMSVPTYRGSAEVYEPVSGKFEPAGPMIDYRDRATATLLGTGQVLVAGGHAENGDSLLSAELYDAATNSFRATAMMTPRGDQTATALPDGRILLVGGYGDYDFTALDDVEGKHHDWMDLFNNPKPIYEYLLERPFDSERHDLLRRLNVQNWFLISELITSGRHAPTTG